MAVLMVMEVPGGTIEQYERVNDLMGIRGDEDAPEGLVQHIAGQDGDKLVVIDVWESREALEHFVGDRLRAALAANDLLTDAPPKILPVHNMLHGKGTNANFAVIIEVADLGTDAYDAMTAHMPAHEGDGSNHPAVSHTVARQDGGGVLVVDLWDSPEAFGKFGEEQVGPAGQKVGLGPIEPRFVPVHNRIRGRAAQRA